MANENSTAVDRAMSAMARNLGYESAEDPAFLASGFDGGFGGIDHELRSDDAALLAERQMQGALNSYDDAKARGER